MCKSEFILIKINMCLNKINQVINRLPFISHIRQPKRITRLAKWAQNLMQSKILRPQNTLDLSGFKLFNCYINYVTQFFYVGTPVGFILSLLIIISHISK